MSTAGRLVRILALSIVAIALAVHASGAQTKTRARPAPKAAAPVPAPAKAPARAEKRVPYHVGERLSYDVSWSTYLTAGTLTLSVDSKKRSYNSTAYYVTAEAQTTGLLARLYTLYYKADTLIDAYTLLPQRGSLYSREGRRERTKVTTFDHAAKKALFEMKTASEMTKDVTLAALTHDMLSSVYVLRAIQPQPGDKLEVPVSDSGWMYKVTFVVGAPEGVKKADGTVVQALRVTPHVIDEKGKPAGDGFVMWLVNDATFAPVRMEGSLADGHIVLTLR